MLSARVATTSAVLLGAPLLACAQTFTPLGDLPGGGEQEFSTALGVSDDGMVVVGLGLSEDASGTVRAEAFRWTEAAGMQGLGHLNETGSQNSRALAVSGDGSVVVGWSTSPSGQQAFRWTAGTGMIGLGDLPGGAFDSVAVAVSNDGSVIVGDGTTADGVEAFRWTEQGGMEDLFQTGQSVLLSSARDISADGSVITVDTGATGVRWENGALVGFAVGLEQGFAGTVTPGPLSGDGNAAFGDVSRPTSTPTLFLRNGGAVEMLNVDSFLNAGNVIMNASNHDGSTFVGEAGGTLEPASGAVIWSFRDGLRNLQEMLEQDYALDLTGWTLRVATGVSADGLTIVGWGTSPNGLPGAWRVQLPGASEVSTCIADVTTTNTNPGEPGYGSPDGGIDGNDLSYYVEQWLNGCP